MEDTQTAEDSIDAASYKRKYSSLKISYKLKSILICLFTSKDKVTVIFSSKTSQSNDTDGEAQIFSLKELTSLENYYVTVKD